MLHHDKHIEKLITRKLDGALSDDESLGLDRLLIRSPEARRLYEDYQRQDATASEALAELFPADEVTAVTVSSLDHARGARRYQRTWWTLPAAVAACLAGLIVFNPPPESQNELGAPDGVAAVGAPDRSPARPIPAATPRRPTRVRAAGHDFGVYDQSIIDQRIGRDWYGVRGSDGNIYWLQIDHARTLRRPGAASRIKLANGDL